MGRVWRALMACGLAASLGAPSVVGARDVRANEWGVNAWGAAPPDVVARPGAGKQCVSPLTGQPGIIFGIRDRRDGAADLILPQSIRPDHSYRFEARVSLLQGQSPARVVLHFRRDGPHYQSTMVRTVDVGAEPVRVVMKGNYFHPDSGSVRVTLPVGTPQICMTDVTLDDIPLDQVGQPDVAYKLPATFFGIHLNRLGAHNSWPKFEPTVVRLWDAGTTWSDLQPRPGAMTWTRGNGTTRMRYFVAHTLKRGENADVMMTLGMPPAWAVEPNAPECPPPTYGPKSCRPPRNLTDWRAFVKEVGDQFEGRVRIWEVWNESDIPMHWTGSAELLASMQRVAYEELKKISPNNVVIGPNVTTSGFYLLNSMLDAGVAKYMDGVSMHAYIGRRPEHAEGAIRNLRQMLSDRGLNLPIWNTESSVVCASPQDCVYASAEERTRQAKWALAQGLLGQAALGVVNVNYFTWEMNDPANGWEPLVEPDYQRTTSFGQFYADLRQFMTGATFRMLSSPASAVTAVEMTQRDGKVCRIWWAASKEPLALDRSLVPAGASLKYVDGEVPAAGGPLRVGRRPLMACAGK